MDYTIEAISAPIIDDGTRETVRLTMVITGCKGFDDAYAIFNRELSCFTDYRISKIEEDVEFQHQEVRHENMQRRRRL